MEPSTTTTSINTPVATATGNPFVGLRPFNSEEALLFFGRREQTVELLERLHQGRFVAVVGSSGCGKSSLVRAGLIPKLKGGFLMAGCDQWRIATLKPGDDPLRHLASALLEIGGSTPAEVASLVEDIRTRGVRAITERLFPAFEQAEVNVLLLVDQFEEIFRFGMESAKSEQRDEAADFVALLLQLTTQQQVPVCVVLTMRSDFLGDCDNFYGLPEALNHSQYLVPRLTREQLRQAIEGPVRLFGAEIAPRLLDRLLNDVGHQSDQLPVLQHALMRTWEWWQIENVRSGDPELDLEHYKKTGTITSALSKDADAAIEPMTDEQRWITERIFCALTDTDENKRRIRRPAHLSELCAIAATESETVWHIIKRFSDSPRSFLTISTGRDSDDPLIDISHESLIRQWGKLGEWMDAEDQSREVYLRLVTAARRHQQLGTSYYTDIDLEEALKWRDERQPNAAWGNRYHQGFAEAVSFLEESEHVRNAELAERAERAEKERQRKINQRNDFKVLMVVISILGWAIANNFWAYKGVEPDRQYGYRHDGYAKLQGHDATVLSMAWSPDGKRLASGGDDKTVKLWDVESGQVLATLKEHEDSVISVAWSPDGKRLASGSHDNTVKLWDVESGQVLATLKGHEGGVWSVAWSPDGKQLASGSDDSTVKLWDVRSRQSIATLKEHEDSVWSVAWSPDGKGLASGGRGGTVKLWDVEGRQSIATLKGHENGVLSVAWSPDGKRLASGSFDHTVKLWGVRNRQSIATLKGHEATVRSVSWSPDGKRLASGGDDKTVTLWEVRPELALKHKQAVLSVAWSPDGKRLASGGVDHTVKLWDMGSGQVLATLKGHEGSVWSVAWSPDGKQLASGSGDKTVKLWDVESGQVLATLKGHEVGVESVWWSPDGRQLASGSGDKTVKLWDVESGQVLATLKGYEGGVWSVAWSPDGKRLASGGYNSTVKLWDVRSTQSITTLKGHKDSTISVAWSPDGKRLASGSYDKTVKLWDVESGQVLATLKGHEDKVWSVAWSPDGKQLASGSIDGTIVVWITATETEVVRRRNQ